MSGRAAVRMTAAELAAFLAANHKVAVSTIDHRGFPHVTALFYVLEAGEIAFWTYRSSQKVRNLERESRVGALVEDGTSYDELRGATIRGRAEIITEIDRVEAIGTKVALRMMGLPPQTELDAAVRAGISRQAAKRVAVVIHAEQVATWDHAKLSRDTHTQS